MYRLGLAEMKGELSLSRNMRDGHKWLKRSSEAATPQYPHALHELGLLHEKGCEPVIFSDLKYAVSLYHDAAALGYAPSAYRLGQCYEFGKLNVTPDPTLSITYYSIAAEQNHPDACFSLTAWYLVGIPDSLEPSDELAYAWAMRAAEYGLPRAEYAVGYFMEMGIGTDKDEAKAIEYYQKAAQHGEKRALQRLGQHPIVESQQKQKKKLFSDGSSPVPSKRESAAKNRMSFMSVSSRQSSTGSLFQKATSFWRRSSMQK
jgi:TPR repeat protein